MIRKFLQAGFQVKKNGNKWFPEMSWQLLNDPGYINFKCN
jgi:hypothetical protein